MFEIPLQKIDEERRLIIGQAAAEGLDKSGESMDYASSKDAFATWSSEFERNTNGLSKGNLRVMHTKEVAGKIVDLSFDDATKAVNIVAHVVSDNAWALCKSGCFSGFSIGGGYAKRWTDSAGLKKYTPRVAEISLVDNPCIKTARFLDLIKADGMIEHIELRHMPRTFVSMWQARPVSFDEAWNARPQTFDEMAKNASWSADKHPRTGGGKFAHLDAIIAAAPTRGSGEKIKLFGRHIGNKFTPEESKAVDAAYEAEDQKAALVAASPRTNPLAGAAEGGVGGAALYSQGSKAGPAVIRAGKFGLGVRGARNETASLLRANPQLREEIRRKAGGARRRATPAPGEMADAARRKVFEEAKQRGSSLEEAKIAGDRFAERITRRLSGGKADTRGPRAAVESIKQNIYATNVNRAQLRPQPVQPKGKFGHLHALKRSLPFSIVGSVLGEQAAYRLQHEEDGLPVNVAHKYGAAAGDALRALSGANIGAVLGAATAVPVSLYMQGIKSKADLPRVNMPKLTTHMMRGGMLGIAASIARNLPQLIREHQARNASKSG